MFMSWDRSQFMILSAFILSCTFSVNIIIEGWGIHYKYKSI